MEGIAPGAVMVARLQPCHSGRQRVQIPLDRRYAGWSMTPIRMIIGVLLVAIVAVALVPMFVLVDLASGGDGFGLCAGGSLTNCTTSYFDGPELLAGLTMMIFLLLMVLRMALHARRMVDGRQRRRATLGAITGARRIRQG